MGRYNSRHQQTKVETGDGSIQENRYDAENLRFELIEDGKRTRFVYHNSELLYEEGGDDQKLNRNHASYHQGMGIDAVQREEELSYYHRDEQLSTAFLTGSNGDVQNGYLYDAFGMGLEEQEKFPNRIRYTGQQYDELTGQYYLRARYYNPAYGRFTHEDVYQGDGLNLYAYCHNNPVVYYDPSGYNTAAGCGNAATADTVNEQKMEVGQSPIDVDAEIEKLLTDHNLKNINDVWTLSGTERGRVIEQYLALTEYSDVWNCGAEWNGYFPVVDFASDTDAVSLKTIDPTLSSYANGSADRKIIDYIDYLASFDITVDDVSVNRILDVRIPEGTENMLNLTALEKAAQESNIILRISEFVK